MSISLKAFVAEYLYNGRLIELSGIGPNIDGNNVRYDEHKSLKLEPGFNGRVLLPMDVIEAARAGDPLILECVL